MQRIKCRVEELREYVDTIWHVALTPQQAVSFKPGQYLLVVMSDSDKRPFSIANSPTRSGVLELQIGATPENAYAGQVLARMREQGEIEIELADWMYREITEGKNPDVLTVHPDYFLIGVTARK